MKRRLVIAAMTFYVMVLAFVIWDTHTTLKWAAKTIRQHCICDDNATRQPA